MVGYVLENTLTDHGTVSRAICERDENGFLQKIVECPKIAKDGDRAKKQKSDYQYNGGNNDPPTMHRRQRVHEAKIVRRVPDSVSYTHLDVYKRQTLPR